MSSNLSSSGWKKYLDLLLLIFVFSSFFIFSCFILVSLVFLKVSRKSSPQSLLHKNDINRYIFGEDIDHHIFQDDFGEFHLECTGHCYCSTSLDTERRNNIRSVRSMKYIVTSALSISFGLGLAQKHFENECNMMMISNIDEEENCDTLHSEVDSCVPTSTTTINEEEDEIEKLVEICVAKCLVSSPETNGIFLVSSCLIGVDCKYNGGNNHHCSDSKDSSYALDILQKKGLLVPICPECDGGMSIPRPPSEIEEQKDGNDVIEGSARVYSSQKDDVTKYFLKGADIALLKSKKIAILKDSSPSCGTTKIHDGTFGGVKKPGVGVTAAMLRKNGVIVVNENQVIEALKIILGEEDRE